MEYSQKTQELIDRMCRNVEREDFVLEKEKAEELILKTYDLFDLSRPKKIVWCADLNDKNFVRSAWSPRSTWSAWSASSASSAWSASSASSAWSTWSASSAQSASSARSTWSTWSTWSAQSALDFGFDCFITGFEYSFNPDVDKLPNDNDKKYLEYSELLMQAKEAGLGYRVESGDTLYLVPTPLVKLNNQNQFHSEIAPAIRWKGASEFYFLNGIKFEKDLWEKILSGKMTFSEIMAIGNVEQRVQALSYNPQAILNSGAELVHKSDNTTNELWKLENSEINKMTELPKMYFLKFIDPSKKEGENVMVEDVYPLVAELTPNADVCQAYNFNLTYEEYIQPKIES